MTELKPCPNCKTNDNLLSAQISKSRTFQIMCMGCGYEGPYIIANDFAVMAWNDHIAVREASEALAGERVEEEREA